MNAFDPSRRAFLKTTAVAGGGLMVGITLPSASLLADQDRDFTPNAFLTITADNEVIFTCPLSMSYILGMTLIFILLPSSRLSMVPILSCSLDSNAIITSSMSCLTNTSSMSLKCPKCSTWFSSA